MMTKSFVAYVCLLWGFVALGAFVYAAGTDSPLTGVLGAALALILTAAVVGFRAGARQLAESNRSGIPIEGVNVWAKPLRGAQIDRYLKDYRHEQADREPDGDVVVMTKRELPRAA